MNGTEKMQSAQSQLLAAQIAIAAEQFEALQEQLKVAKAEGRGIDERITEVESSLAAQHGEAEPLWEQRAIIEQTRAALDAAFEEQDFPSEAQGEEYEEKRATLTNQWHELTKPISVLSGDIARLEDELRQLKFARSRTATAVNDLRRGIAERRGKKQF
jgi:chromosome segregation ATPase